MLNMMRNKSTWCVLQHGVLTAFLLAGSGAALAANVTVELCATAGSVTMPAAPGAINILGYVSGACPATATAPGGLVIDVNVGDSVTVNLHNSLSEATGLLFQGQRMVPDTTGAAAATGATYGAKTYTFTATSPGTFLYEAALLPNAEHQAAMGLHGALIVRPAAVPFTGISVTPTGSGTRSDATATYTSGSNAVVDTSVLSTDLGAVVSGAGIPFGTTITAVSAGSSFTMSARAAAAYGASTVFNDEAVLVLSELDPALNNNANPATFDMRNYAPKYFLINGKAYPDTAPIASAAGNKVLLRYVNAGVKHHSMAVLGLRQNFVAKDASLLPTLTHNVAAETLAPGQTGDAIVTVPAVTSASKFAVYDASLALHNNGADNTFGGMLTFVAAGTGSPNTGPTTSAVAVTPNPTNGSVSVALSASINSSSSTVTAAEYFIDTTGAAGSGIPISGTFGVATFSVNTTLSTAQLATLSSGNHSIYVHGKDANNKWGAFRSAVLNLDKAGPISSGLTLTPNPSSGAVSVALSATGNETTTGGSNVVAAEYFIGATGANGSGSAMTVNIFAPIASLTATIAPPVTGGIVSVHSKDAFGNWGPFATITLNVAAGGPVTSGVGAAPNPNNGVLPLNASQPVVRVTATMTSSGSTIVAAEGFIDTPPLNTTVRGFPFVPSDGAWNGATETGYADIPLANINALSNGDHTIYVRGKDAVGNWGATGTVTLVIDRAPPTVSTATVTPPASNNAPVVISATATDIACTNSICVIGGGEYYIDAVGAPATGAAMTRAAAAQTTTISATIPTTTLSALTAGNHTVYVRSRDAAGNWSAGTASATLLIDRTPPTFSSITLAPNSIVAGVASVNLNVIGAIDPLVAGLASGVAGGEWWMGSSNITAGTGTQFTGTSGIAVATSTLTACTYTVRTRIRDVATNWSTGNNGVRTATLTVTGAPADAIFSDGFEAGNTNAWSSRSTNNTGRLNTSAAAAMVGSIGLQAQGNNTNYVQYDFGTCPPAAPTFDARFYFNPHGNTGSNQDIFVARTTGGATVFRVRYRWNGGVPQVQIQVGTGTANTAWTGITNNALNRIEVVWQTGSTLQLFVGGSPATSQSLTATATSIGQFRLGSVTSGGSNILEYFDGFSAKRSTTPYGP